MGDGYEQFPKDIEKNKLFNEELKQKGLCLSVTRKWGNRTLDPTKSEWRKLREKALFKSDFTCRFCKLRSQKWMVCDHIDGDARNNSMDNLGINCPICDLIRHCGYHNNRLLLLKSELDQIEIVCKTQEYWKKYRKIPKPHEIDPDAKFPDPLYDSIFEVREFANLLMRKNYSELNNDELKLRGFFGKRASPAFIKVFPEP
jgi:hypothetical protein|tara:strand:- start:781 stop:1383 length:603 start_codon:yes stop_codon:yes gene_type:complete